MISVKYCTSCKYKSDVYDVNQQGHARFVIVRCSREMSLAHSNFFNEAPIARKSFSNEIEYHTSNFEVRKPCCNHDDFMNCSNF